MIFGLGDHHVESSYLNIQEVCGVDHREGLESMTSDLGENYGGVYGFWWWSQWFLV